MFLANSSLFQAKVGSFTYFYEGVRLIVLSVVIKTVFTKDLENFFKNFLSLHLECWKYCLFDKTTSLDTVHEMNLIELKKNWYSIWVWQKKCKFTIKFLAFLAKD